MAQLRAFYDGRTALVTGAGSDIGRAIAHHLNANSTAVHCADRDGDAAAAEAAELDNTIAHTVDVTDAAIVKNTAMRGATRANQQRAVAFYEKNGASPNRSRRVGYTTCNAAGYSVSRLGPRSASAGSLSDCPDP